MGATTHSHGWGKLTNVKHKFHQFGKVERMKLENTRMENSLVMDNLANTFCHIRGIRLYFLFQDPNYQKKEAKLETIRQKRTQKGKVRNKDNNELNDSFLTVWSVEENN